MRIGLIIEDDPTSAKAVSLVLERNRFQVSIAATPDEALAFCTEIKLDLIVAEIILRAPLSGTEVACQLRQSCPDIPVLLVSGTPLEGWSDMANSGLDQAFANSHAKKDHRIVSAELVHNMAAMTGRRFEADPQAGSDVFCAASFGDEFQNLFLTIREALRIIRASRRPRPQQLPDSFEQGRRYEGLGQERQSSFSRQSFRIRTAGHYKSLGPRLLLQDAIGQFKSVHPIG
jgi:CheY-like chemotaxis protein